MSSGTPCAADADADAMSPILHTDEQVTTNLLMGKAERGRVTGSGETN